jgi:hypothetical protein
MRPHATMDLFLKTMKSVISVTVRFLRRFINSCKEHFSYPVGVQTLLLLLKEEMVGLAFVRDFLTARVVPPLFYIYIYIILWNIEPHMILQLCL